jgi:hypothetical protein
MSLASDFNKLDETVKLGLCVVGVYILYNLYLYASNPNSQGNPLGFFFPDPNDSAGNPNSIGDTSQAAYAGNGALGSIGNIVNQALGGLPQSLGTAVAGAVSPSYDPNP